MAATAPNETIECVPSFGHTFQVVVRVLPVGRQSTQHQTVTMAGEMLLVSVFNEFGNIYKKDIRQR